MKSRFVRFGVLIASVMGLLVTSTPAEATWVKNVTLVGNANLFNCKDATTGAPSPGLSYPVWTTGTTTTTEVPDTKTTTKTGAKGVPEVNTEVLNGNLCDFRLAADCVKVSVGKKNGVDQCTIEAIGTVTGFCGLSSGLGTAALVNISNTVQPKPTVVTAFKFSSTGTNLRVSDKDNEPTDWIQGDVEAIPDVQVGGGSCTNKTATTFRITGDVVIKDCTPGPIPPPVC